MNKLKLNNGFSLVELLIVISIMGINAAAIAPSLIRYIAKSRRAMDRDAAFTLFEAANLASASSSEEIADGWRVAAEIKNGNSVGRATVTIDGHNASLDKSCSADETYQVSCVAWARGVDYNNWQNAQFKSVLNNGSEGDSQRAFTDEFQRNLYHNAIGEKYAGAGNNKYDGYTDDTIEFKYKKDSGYGKPECWLIMINHKTLSPEVWICDKDINPNSTKLVRPLYRLYPDTCREYRE